MFYTRILKYFELSFHHITFCFFCLQNIFSLSCVKMYTLRSNKVLCSFSYKDVKEAKWLFLNYWKWNIYSETERLFKLFCFKFYFLSINTLNEHEKKISFSIHRHLLEKTSSPTIKDLPLTQWLFCFAGHSVDTWIEKESFFLPPFLLSRIQVLYILHVKSVSLG